MKKTKLLMPLLGVSAVAATVAPIVTMTSCNDKKEAEFTLDKATQQVTAGSEEVNWDVSKAKKTLDVFSPITQKPIVVTGAKIAGTVVPAEQYEEIAGYLTPTAPTKPTPTIKGKIKIAVNPSAAGMTQAGDYIDLKLTIEYHYQNQSKNANSMITFKMRIEFIAA